MCKKFASVSAIIIFLVVNGMAQSPCDVIMYDTISNIKKDKSTTLVVQSIELNNTFGTLDMIRERKYVFNGSSHFNFIIGNSINSNAPITVRLRQGNLTYHEVVVPIGQYKEIKIVPPETMIFAIEAIISKASNGCVVLELSSEK